jgi:hypothetical protein
MENASETSVANPSTRQSRRLWWGLGVGGVLLVFVVWLPWYLHTRVIAEIERMGGGIDAEPVGPRWLRAIVGEKMRDRFGRVQSVYLGNTQVTNAGLVQIKGWTDIQEVSLKHTKVSDDGLVHLRGLVNLRELNIRDTQVTDAGLEHLKGLTKLDDLNLSHTQITDVGLEHLKGMKRLRSLVLYDTLVTHDGVRDLKTALPRCAIAHDWWTPRSKQRGRKDPYDRLQ